MKTTLLSGARSQKNSTPLQVVKMETEGPAVSAVNVGLVQSTLKLSKENGRSKKTTESSNFGSNVVTSGERFPNKFKEEMRFKSRIGSTV
jgi:hypothetical protein